MNLGDLNDQPIKYTQREIEHIKYKSYSLGHREGVLVGSLITAVIWAIGLISGMLR